MIDLNTYHRYAQLFDAFAMITGDGTHCNSTTLFESDAGPALREWAAEHKLDVASEDNEIFEAGRATKWTRLQVRIGRHAEIIVHLDVAVTVDGKPVDLAPQPEAEPEIAF